MKETGIRCRRPHPNRPTRRPAVFEGSQIMRMRSLLLVIVSVAALARPAFADTPVSFTREIVPILTKAGCNQGACHGAQHGRGGFKLSLLGFDPAFDYPQIVQSAEG